MGDTENKEETANFATELLHHLVVQNKRIFVALIISLFMLFASNIIWIFVFNQYDFQSYELESNDGGNANFIGNDGDINNGIGKSKTENEEKSDIGKGNGN